MFPKLNWSSPRDASWIVATNTLKCHHAADIFLLLKSSDFVAHDLAHAYEDCSDEAGGQTGAGIRQRPERVELVLRKWFDLAPSMEFRCFVKDNKLVGKGPIEPGGSRSTMKHPEGFSHSTFCSPDPILGISQRDMTYYDFLKDLHDELEQKIVDFYENKIQGRFPDPDCK